MDGCRWLQDIGGVDVLHGGMECCDCLVLQDTLGGGGEEAKGDGEHGECLLEKCCMCEWNAFIETGRVVAISGSP